MDLRTRLIGVLLATAASLASAAVLAQTAGRVSAVNPDSTGTPAGAQPRVLAIGTDVTHKEVVKTSSQGSTQIVFPDQSTLNVGRNSSITIDEYVYDPAAGAGRMTASIGKGLLRFVGGQISHTVGATFKTPMATLGVRGGVATIAYANAGEIDPSLRQCGQFVIGHVGAVTVNNQVSQVVVRPGFSACVTAANAPIAAPTRVSDLVLGNAMRLLTSGAGQHGSAIHLPTDDGASRFGIGHARLDDPTSPPGSKPLDYIKIIGAGDAVARSKSQANQTTQVIPPPPPPPPPCDECGDD